MKQITTQHTPGPWTTDTGSVWTPDNPPMRGHVIADVPTAFGTITVRAPGETGHCPAVDKLNGIGEANARLISAAPDLLAALCKAVEHQCFTNERLYEAHAAIAKAKGGHP